MLNLDVIVEKGQKGKVIKKPVKAFIVGLLYVVLQVSDHYWIALSWKKYYYLTGTFEHINLQTLLFLWLQKCASAIDFRM